MNIELGTMRNSAFVGVFSVLTDKIALLPKTLDKKETKQVEKLFDVEIIQTNLANSSILGVLAIGNSKGFAVSEIVEDSEIDELREKGMKAERVEGITAIGNLAECNDERIFCSKAVPKKARNKCEEILKAKCVETKIAKSDLVGSNIVLTNKGFIANPLVSDTEFKKIEKETGLEGSAATANFGDKFVGNGVVANSKAALAGNKTSGHELIRIDEGLRGE